MSPGSEIRRAHRQQGPEREAVAGAQRRRLVEDVEQGGELVRGGLAQPDAVVEEHHVAGRRQPGQVAQAVGQRVPVGAEGVREPERVGEGVEQAGAVLDAVQVHAGDVEALRARGVGERGAVAHVHVVGAGLAGIGASKAALRQLKRIAAKQHKNGRPLIEDTLFRSQIAEVEMSLMAAEMSTLRIVAAASEGGVPGSESSILKVQGTEIRQAITHLMRKALGPYAMPFLPEEMELDYDGDFLVDDYSASLASVYFNMRKLSIFGGSNEIQKNIVSKMILEL